MADEPQISILDARLAEIDRRLRTIQTGLADDAGSPAESGSGLAPKLAVPEPRESARRPVALAPAPRTSAPSASRVPEDGDPTEAELPDEDPSLVIAELRGLISDHARLLDAMGDLLASGERLLTRAHEPALEERRAAPQASSAPPAVPQVTVTAGPFLSLEAVREFERALSTLPNVASVDLRGYQGEDRAMVDVHLSRPNP